MLHRAGRWTGGRLHGEGCHFAHRTWHVYTMPGMNGIDVSQHLRHDPRTAAIPLIAISADPELLASRQLAVNGCLCKPFKNDDLYGILARWLHKA
jgi:CheY-like chemotaxis protein